MNISPYDFQLQFTFASDKLAELDRKLALLYSTREGTMPLDREFGINMDLSRRCGCNPWSGPTEARDNFFPRW